MSLRFYGVTQATEDVDIVVNKEEWKQFRNNLPLDFRFTLSGQLEHILTGVKIDVIFSGDVCKFIKNY